MQKSLFQLEGDETGRSTGKEHQCCTTTYEIYASRLDDQCAFFKLIKCRNILGSSAKFCVFYFLKSHLHSVRPDGDALEQGQRLSEWQRVKKCKIKDHTKADNVKMCNN